MAESEFIFRSFKTIAPAFIKSSNTSHVGEELTDFEPLVENAAGDVIHLPLQRGSDKFYINSGSRTYSVSLFYHFPEDVRNNAVTYNWFRSGATREGTYGADNMTFRRLYEILCQRYNNGRYFIDDYFNDSPWYLGDNYSVKEQISDILDQVQEKMQAYDDLAGRWVPRNKSGTADMRYNRSKEYMEGMRNLESQALKEGLQDLSRRIKEDIVQRLMLGEIPLSNPELSESTRYRKEAAGFAFPDSKFYATGQLINSISIDFYVWSDL
jgi:hypothetical protein